MGYSRWLGGRPCFSGKHKGSLQALYQHVDGNAALSKEIFSFHWDGKLDFAPFNFPALL